MDVEAFVREWRGRLPNQGNTEEYLQKLGEIMIKAADPFISTQLATQATGKELATQFINLVVEESVLLKSIRVHRTDKPSGDLTKLTVSGPVTESASENTEGTETRRPTSTGLTYTTAKSRSMMDLSGETEEDNIEGAGGRASIMRAMISAISNDMEDMGIQGDDSLAGTDDTSRLRRTNDGFHVLTASGEGARVFDAGGTRVSRELLSQMIKNMPTKYRRNPGKLRFIMSLNTQQSFNDDIVDRTTNLGDAALTGQQIAPYGVPILPVPLMPEDLTLTGTDSLGTFIWLCDPKNFIYVVQRMLRVEWERVPRKDISEMTAYMRTDFLVENTDAVVKATGVTLDETADRYTN